MRISNTSREWPRGRLCARICCLTVALCGAAHAVDPDRAMSQYVRDRWGPGQGFPRGPVYAIAQSADGYLWIGTEAGLVRFDGLKFQILRAVPGIESGEAVLGLMPDRDGTLWIRSEGILLRYRNGVFDNPAAPLTSRVTAMSRTKEGDLLFTLMGRGAMVYSHGKFEMIAHANGLPRSPVLAIAQTADGSIWSGTRGSGLFRQRAGQTFSVSEGLPDPKVNCLVSGSNGDLWAGTDSGMVRWNGTRLVAAGPASLNALQVLALERDRDGNIWAGTDAGGLLRINGRGVSYLDEPGQSLEAVTALFEDREGNLWIGSANGIERLRDSAFVTYSLPEGLPTDSGDPVFVDSDGRLWFPPVDGGLWWMKDGRPRSCLSWPDWIMTSFTPLPAAREICGSDSQRGGLTMLRTDEILHCANLYQADGLGSGPCLLRLSGARRKRLGRNLSGGVSRLQRRPIHDLHNRRPGCCRTRLPRSSRAPTGPCGLRPRQV